MNFFIVNLQLIGTVNKVGNNLRTTNIKPKDTPKLLSLANNNKL